MRNLTLQVFTGYDAHRHAVEQQLKACKLPHEDRVFNLDTFQGREEDVIIVSLGRSFRMGFLANDLRINVMLTR